VSSRGCAFERNNFLPRILVLLPHLGNTNTTTPDFRHHVRPFFLTTDGQRSTSHKIYYDIFTYLVTQTAFCFTTAPFVLLTLPASLLVWARVYFYAIIGTVASMAFFASPAKPWLERRLKQRNQHALQPPKGKAEDPFVGLGLPDDPAGDIDEAVKEVREEVEARRRRGQSISMPTGADLKPAVEVKLGKKLS